MDTYTIDDIYALPEGIRAELIDGQIYYMASPTRTHQRISMSLSRVIGNYIESQGVNCEIYAAPFAVFLNEYNRIPKMRKTLDGIMLFVLLRNLN